MLKQPIYYEFNLDARTSPSKLIAISHVDDKYSEVLEVAVKQNDRFVYMGGATVVARMVLHREKDYLLSDSVPCTVNANGNILIPFDNAVVKTSQGVVKIEVNITRDTDELTLQFPLWVSVTGSILDNAEVTPESEGTIPDLLKEAADALEDATEALENLGNYDNLDNKPQINGVTLSGNKTPAELGLQKALTAGDNVNIDANGNITITGIVKYADGADGQAGTDGELAALDGNGALKRSGVTVTQSVGEGSTDKVPTTEAVRNALNDAEDTTAENIDSIFQGNSAFFPQLYFEQYFTANGSNYRLIYDDKDGERHVLFDFAQLPTTVEDGSVTLDKLHSGVIDSTLSTQGAAAEAKTTGEARNRFDSTVQGASSTNTSNSIYLKTGETAKITISDFDGTSATAFIKGHSSPSLSIYRDGVYKFTAQYDGLLTLYGAGTTTFIADVELMTLAAVRLENTQAQADSNTLEIDALKDTVFSSVNGDVEQGSYHTAGGWKYDTDIACRTASYTPQTALRAVFNDGIKAGVRAFDINGTYVGGYTGSGFSTNYTQFVKLDSPIALRDLTAEYDYNLRLVFTKSAGGNIVPNDVGLQYEVSAIPDEAEIDALKDAVFPFVNGDVEQGSYDTAGGGKHDTDRACRTASYTPQTALRAVFNDGIKAGVRAFDINGTYVGGYTGSGFSTDYTQFAKLDSPIALRDFTAEYGYNWKLAFIKSAGGNIVPNDVGLQYEVSAIPDEAEIYTVGTNGDFSGFTEMLIALASNSKEKIVYVYGGVYDIFDEMGGAEYISSIENASSLSWRGVNHIVPPNTTIIGVGKVVLEWNPSDSEIISQNHAFLFSPLNLSGSCTIKNIEIRCSNCRYGIHDETGGRAVYNGTTRVLDNVRVYYTASTYGVHYAYGAGHNKNSKYIYNNCVFSAAYGIAWSSHDWPATEYENSTFEFNNCIFKNNLPTSPSGKAGIRFSSTATDSRQDIVKINGCDFNNITFGTEGSSSVKQGYTVTTMLCPSFTVTYTDRIASGDRIAPTVYLSVS